MKALVTDVHLPSAVSGVRGLGRAQCQVVALGDGWSAAGLWSRYATSRAVGPTPGDDAAAFALRVLELAGRHGPLAVYPGSESAITALFDHGGCLGEAARLPYLDTPVGAIRSLRDKGELAAVARSACLAVPRTLARGTACELAALAVPTPSVVKPVYSGGEPSTARVVTSEQAFGDLLAEIDPSTELLVQECVPGPLLMLALVLDDDGRPVARFQQVAGRVWPSEAGGASLAVSVSPDDQLVGAATQMLAAVGFSGLAQLDFIDAVDGPLLVDVNPRYYASMPLALACGVNLPAVWHDVVRGDRPPPERRYPIGVSFRWLEADLRAAVKGVPRVLAQRVPAPKTGAMWARDDPVPGALLFERATRSRLLRLFGREPRARARVASARSGTGQTLEAASGSTAARGVLEDQNRSGYLDPPSPDAGSDGRGALSWRSLLSAASWMSAAHIVAQAFAYCSLILLARLIPPQSFGTMASGMALVWVAAMVMETGTHGSIVVSPRLTPALLRRGFLRCLLAATVLAVAMAVAADTLADTVAKGADAGALAALALGLPLYAAAVVPVAVLHRTMQFRKLARTTAAANMGSATAAVVAGLAGAGVWALVLRQLLWFALLAALATAGARAHMPFRTSGQQAAQPSSSSHGWFLLFGITLAIAQNLDYLVIGTLGDVTRLGLYAFAYMVAFAPVHHFSDEVGKVLFAAAASDRASSGERTVRAVRAMALLLLPLAPVAVVLAPSVVPAVLGREWDSMVAPFQVLVVVAIAHTLVDCVGEALSGVGQIAFRAKLNVAWCLVLFLVMIPLVRADGIRGAALAHLAVFVPYAAVYATVGARRIGTSAGQLGIALRPALFAVGLQGAVTGTVAAVLGAAGATRSIAAAVGALAGLGAFVTFFVRAEGGALREVSTFLRTALRRRAASAAAINALPGTGVECVGVSPPSVSTPGTGGHGP